MNYYAVIRNPTAPTPSARKRQRAATPPVVGSAGDALCAI